MRKGLKTRFARIILTIVFMIDVALMFSHFAHPETPSNIIGYTPYVIRRDDDIMDLKKGDLMIAEIPSKRAERDDVVCYRDGKTIGMGKVIETSKGWYRIENENERIYIVARQTIGIKVIRISCVGWIIIFIVTHIQVLILGMLIILIIEILRYYRNRISLIYIEEKEKEERK